MDLARKDISNKLMILRREKNNGITTFGRKKTRLV